MKGWGHQTKEPKPPGMLSIYNKSTYPEDRRLKVAAVISVLPGRLIILKKAIKKEKIKILPKGEQNLEKAEGKKNEKNSMCEICLQEKTGPGIRHPCGQVARKHNLAALTLNEGSGCEQVLADVLKGILKKKNTGGSGNSVHLKQLKGGQRLKVIVGEKKKLPKRVHVSSMTVVKIKKRLKLSDRSTETVYHVFTKRWCESGA